MNPKRIHTFLETSQFPTLHVGIDEAGRGPWAGPVVAAAVYLRGQHLPGLNDSKVLSEEKRHILYEALQSIADIGVGIIDNHRIDEVGIRRATFEAMTLALRNLSMDPEYLLIDGRDNFPFETPHTFVVKGDSLYESIAAASIVAKVTRDHLMYEYAEKFPEYAFEKHKGYGTKLHQKLLAKHGVCDLHRKSYKPIAHALLNI